MTILLGQVPRRSDGPPVAAATAPPAVVVCEDPAPHPARPSAATANAAAMADARLFMHAPCAGVSRGRRSTVTPGARDVGEREPAWPARRRPGARVALAPGDSGAAPTDCGQPRAIRAGPSSAELLISSSAVGGSPPRLRRMAEGRAARVRLADHANLH